MSVPTCTSSLARAQKDVIRVGSSGRVATIDCDSDWQCRHRLHLVGCSEAESTEYVRSEIPAGASSEIDGLAAITV
jgi:hypothetical protein